MLGLILVSKDLRIRMPLHRVARSYSFWTLILKILFIDQTTDALIIKNQTIFRAPR